MILAAMAGRAIKVSNTPERTKPMPKRHASQSESQPPFFPIAQSWLAILFVLVFCFPFSQLQVGIDYRGDIVIYILLLPPLFVKGDQTGGQILENTFDVCLWTASEAYTQIWKV